jgi:hypothetical protein
MNLNEKLKNYLTHEENDFLKVENSYNKKTSYLVGFEFASGSLICFFIFLFIFRDHKQIKKILDILF